MPTQTFASEGFCERIAVEPSAPLGKQRVALVRMGKQRAALVRMFHALPVIFLLALASAEKGYNRNRTKLAIPKFVGSPPTAPPLDRGPTARIVGGAPPLPCVCARVRVWL